jgi:hypothetical protein
MNKYNTYVPQNFSQEELTKRIEASSGWIDVNVVLCEESRFFLDNYDALIKQGYKRSSDQPVLIMNNLLQVVLGKPQKLLDKEFAALAAKVESEYLVEIEADRAQALERMANRLLCEAREKQEKQVAAVQAELEAAAMLEARQILNLQGEV